MRRLGWACFALGSWLGLTLYFGLLNTVGTRMTMWESVRVAAPWAAAVVVAAALVVGGLSLRAAK